MSLEVVTLAQSHESLAEPREREKLVRRVTSSVTFEKSPRLRAFLVHVCRCALEDRSDEATEQQIGIHVYGRSPSYNPNDDNIVRSQARVLRLKLEHHFANEGSDEPVVITIPKGQYLAVFAPRTAAPLRRITAPSKDLKTGRRTKLWVGVGILVAFVFVLVGYSVQRWRSTSSTSFAVPAATAPAVGLPKADIPMKGQPIAGVTDAGVIRIAAGHTGPPYVDAWGHRWQADRDFEGGVVRPGPQHFFPPVPEEGLFRTIREAYSGDEVVPQSQREFHYSIPLRPGVYELRLYFADPLRQPVEDTQDDSQNVRHFHVVANGRPLLTDLDPIADAGASAVDIRVFKDVRAAEDGKLHLDFRTDWGKPAFVSAIEITPGLPGKLNPIRVSARRSDFVDANGLHWSGDNYFVYGRTFRFEEAGPGPNVEAFYSGERHGNFSYAIPVTPGSYTVRLHFMESFFSPSIHAAHCHGEGCRVFDVTCNGVSLLQNFDIFQAAGGAFHPVVREFHGLRPNGQGKLLLSFSPTVNYAEIRAIEVIDEAK
jgi:hypothetical protein